MALKATESMCTRCVELYNKATDYKTSQKYANPGTYRKVSEVNDSFSYKKATLGAAVFGPVGAVAGINGKKPLHTDAINAVTRLPEKNNHIVTGGFLS